MPGVRRILGTPEGPSPVDNEIIASIRSRMDRDGHVEVRSSLPIGGRVRLREGPLVGLRGILESYINSKQRVRVLLDLLNASLDVDCSLLERE